MIASKQINIDHRRVWLFYNEIRAVAQCPYDWGVGSAFHPMKIHILCIWLYVDVPGYIWMYLDVLGSALVCHDLSCHIFH